MVTIQDDVQYVNGVACTTQKVWCKSTDVKPTEGIGNGSQLREMDTGKNYAFDAENGEWLEQPEEGGGGGDGGGAGLVVPNISITMTGQNTATATCDLSRAAIASAIANGAICVAKITNDSAWDAGNYRLTTSIMVVENDEENGPYVAFTVYELLDGGDVRWYIISVYDDAVDCFIDRTNSYPSN